MGMIAYNRQSMNGQGCQGMGQQLDQFFNIERLSDFDYQEHGLFVFHSEHSAAMLKMKTLILDHVLIPNLTLKVCRLV